MVPAIGQLLRFALDQGASDLHLSAGQPPLLRICGGIRRVDLPSLSAEDMHRLIEQIMTEGQRRTFQERLELEFAYALDGSARFNTARFRVSAFMQSRGEGAVFRAIPGEVPTMTALGLPEVVRRFAEERRGLVLVTGPSGSGKTTTLASMIDHFNGTIAGHVLTLENPIEFVHTPKRCLINQREIGRQSHSWADALQSALREDPDVILVGELNDFETISRAVAAAETGHLVLGALRTSSAPKTLDRILDMCPTDEQRQLRTMIADSLLGVVSQALVKKRDGSRVAAHEILVATPAVRNLIREGKMQQIPSSMQVVGKSGMQTMETALVTLVTRGIVEVAEARACLPGSEMLAMLHRTSSGGTAG